MKNINSTNSFTHSFISWLWQVRSVLRASGLQLHHRTSAQELVLLQLDPAWSAAAHRKAVWPNLSCVIPELRTHPRVAFREKEEAPPTRASTLSRESQGGLSWPFCSCRAASVTEHGVKRPGPGPLLGQRPGSRKLPSHGENAASGEQMAVDVLASAAVVRWQSPLTTAQLFSLSLLILLRPQLLLRPGHQRGGTSTASTDFGFFLAHFSQRRLISTVRAKLHETKYEVQRVNKMTETPRGA